MASAARRQIIGAPIIKNHKIEGGGRAAALLRGTDDYEGRDSTH